MNKNITLIKSKVKFNRPDKTATSSSSDAKEYLFDSTFYNMKGKFYNKRYNVVRNFNEVLHYIKGEKTEYIEVGDNKTYKHGEFVFTPVNEDMYMTPLYYSRGMLVINCPDKCALLSPDIVGKMYNFFGKKSTVYPASDFNPVPRRVRLRRGGAFEVGLDAGKAHFNKDVEFNLLVDDTVEGLPRAWIITKEKGGKVGEYNSQAFAVVGIGLTELHVQIVLSDDIILSMCPMPFDTVISLYKFVSNYGRIRNRSIEGKEKLLNVLAAPSESKEVKGDSKEEVESEKSEDDDEKKDDDEEEEKKDKEKEKEKSDSSNPGDL